MRKSNWIIFPGGKTTKCHLIPPPHEEVKLHPTYIFVIFGSTHVISSSWKWVHLRTNFCNIKIHIKIFVHKPSTSIWFASFEALFSGTQRLCGTASLLTAPGCLVSPGTNKSMAAFLHRINTNASGIGSQQPKKQWDFFSTWICLEMVLGKQNEKTFPLNGFLLKKQWWM